LGGDPTGQVYTLSHRQLTYTDSVPIKHWICEKVTYGRSRRHSIDVTNIVKKNKSVNIAVINPNHLFGDPCPGQAKKLLIYIKGENKPIILKELCGQISQNNDSYRLEWKDDSLQLTLYAQNIS